ncbi:TPA: relaxase/mobilization nuclease domain-containing protein [Clostridioides difficile]|nr:relaxase/mobilization nuclease domain-containing protein [Clostridioides difficile]
MAVIKSLPATKSLSNQLKYLEKEGKTVEELKEGINCTTDNVEREFNIVKQLHNKTEGKQYYHFTQAFSPEDKITPEKAHQLGKEWIERNIQGHQVYMVTHIDKNHIHNHFVINSVNMDNGLKLQISPYKLLEMKKDSNSVCDREKLSKINLEPNKGISKTDSEYRLEKKGVIPWKDELRQCIDFGRSKTKSIEELKEYLKEHFNIEVRETKNSISYKHPEQNKSVRGNKLGGDYTKEGLLSEFNARETKSNEGGREGATSSSNVNWSAIRDNVKGEGNRISEQPSNDVIGAIQRKVREVKKRTDRITGIDKSEGQDPRGQQSDIQQDNKPRSGENQPSNIRSVEEPKPKVREVDWGLDR